MRSIFNTRFTKPGRCDEEVRKDLGGAYPKALRGNYSEAMQGRLTAGVEFEDTLIDQLRELHGTDEGFVFINGGDDRNLWLEESLAALNNPKATFIVNPHLPNATENGLSGDPDFLVRTEDGQGWLPVDAKHHKEMVGTSKNTKHTVSDLTSPFFQNAEVLEGQIGNPHSDDSVQLAHYHTMLKELGFNSPAAKPVGGIIGTSGRIYWRRLDIPLTMRATQSPLEMMRTQLEWRKNILATEEKRIKGDATALPLVGPIVNSLCGDCPWRKVCWTELEAADHPTLLPGVTKAAWKKLQDAGVLTRLDLAKLDWFTAKLLVDKVDVVELIEATDGFDGSVSVNALDVCDSKLLDKLEQHGIATVADIQKLDYATAELGTNSVSWLPRAIDQARVHHSGRVHLDRGVNFVGFTRGAIEIDIDIEDSEGYVYLFGALVSGRKKRNGEKKTRSEYYGFTSWDETAQGEAKAFAEFWKLLEDKIEYAKANRYGIKIYHYSHHEITAFRKLAELHKGKPGVPTLEAVDELIQSEYWIDLYPVIKKQMLWPTGGYSIKDIAKHVRHSWTGDGASGALSLIQYDRAVNDPDEDERELAREELLVYNREDNEATLKVRDWISDLSVTERRPGEKLSGVEALDEYYRQLAQVK